MTTADERRAQQSYGYTYTRDYNVARGYGVRVSRDPERNPTCTNNAINNFNNIGGKAAYPKPSNAGIKAKEMYAHNFAHDFTTIFSE